MEKFRTKNRNIVPRLLIILLTMFVPAYAVSVEPQLHIVSQQQYCFTETNCQFNLKIVDVDPENVQSYVEDLQDSVTLVSLRKDDLAADINAQGQRGTLIQMWFEFAKPGLFNIGTLTVRISGKLYRVLFDPVVVYENPNTVQPELFITFSNPLYQKQGNLISCSAGTHLDFTIYIRYAVQIVNYSWKLPQDSIFTELKRYEITEGNPRGKGFSPDAVPLASFEWQPLTSGKWNLPLIVVTATAYNGSRFDLTLPNYEIAVSESSTPAESAASENSVFAYAFSEPVDVTKGKMVSVQKLEHPQKIVELRKKERHSFPFSKVAEQRREAEIKEGLVPGENEPSVPLFICLLLLSATGIAFTIIFIVIKKNRGAAISFAVTALILTGTIICGVMVSRTYALFIGGSVNSIPEEKINTSITIRAGSRVQVQHRAGDWVYVRSNDTYGWVQKENVYYIK
jgi:hypothetical protein